MKKWCIIICSMGMCLPLGAGAKTLNDLNDSYKMLDYHLRRVEKLVRSARKLAMGKKFNAMQRLMNGVYLLKNKRPQEAAALFMSLINHPKLGKEAIFYYSEAMYASGNYLLAAEFYKKVMTQKWDKRFRSKAIKRILEISMKTQGSDNARITDLIKTIQKVIEEAPEIKNSPEVKYALGKYAYFQGAEEFAKPVTSRNEAWGLKRLQEALALFGFIRPREKGGKNVYPVLYPQAVYYSGATLVKMALSGAVAFTRDGKLIKLDQYTSSPVEMKEILLYEAISRFSILAGDGKMLKLLKGVKRRTGQRKIHFFEAKTPEQKAIRTLARLAMGRIFYELGETGESIRWYKTLGKESGYYEDALFELAWVYVREGEIMKAAQTLAIMEVRNKNSVFLPRAKLLLGYLKVRSKKYVDASQSFNKTSRRYKKVHKSLKELMGKRLEPQTFFDQIMRSNDGNKRGKKRSQKQAFQERYRIPAEAIPIFKEDRNLMKAILISDDIRTIKRGLLEAKNALRVIKRRIQSASKVAIFPLLNGFRKRTYQYEFSNMELRRGLLKIAMTNFSALLQGQLRDRLVALDSERKIIEKRIATMPKSTDSLNKKLKAKRSVYEEKIKVVDDQIKYLKGFLQQLDQFYIFYNGFTPEKKARLKGIVEKFRKEAASIKASLALATLIRSKIVDASLDVGVDDDDMSRERSTRARYRNTIRKIFELFGTVRQRMTASQSVLYDKILTLLHASSKLDGRLDAVNSKIHALAETKLVEIKHQVQVEERNITGYDTLYKDYTKQSGRLSKEVSRDSVYLIAKEFQKIVIEADLGIVDVSWQKRSGTRNRWSRLNRRKARITEELESRFRAVQDAKADIEKGKYADPFEESQPKKQKTKGAPKKSGAATGKGEPK